MSKLLRISGVVLALAILAATARADQIDTVTIALPGDDLAFRFNASDLPLTLPTIVTVSGVYNETLAMPVGMGAHGITMGCFNVYDCPVGASLIFIMSIQAPIAIGDDLIPGAYMAKFPNVDFGPGGPCQSREDGIYPPECFPTLTIVGAPGSQNVPEMSTGASVALGLLLLGIACHYGRRRPVLKAL